MNHGEDEEILRARFGHHAAAGLGSAIIIRGLGIVLVKVLSIFLTKDDYGTYAFWLALVFLISTISTSPFSATLWRYLQKKRSDSPVESSRLLGLSFVGAAIMLVIAFGTLGLLFALIGYRVVENSLYLSSLMIASILTVFYIIKEYVLVISGTEQNSREIFLFNLAFGISSTAVAALLAILFSNLLMVLVGLCIGYAIPSFISLAIKLKEYRLSRMQKEDIRLVASFGGPIMVANSASNAMPFIASFFVAMWIGLSGVGTLSIAQIIAGLLSFVIGPVLMAYNAYMVLTYEQSDFEMGNRISGKVVELFISLVTPLVWLIASFSLLLISLISTGEYLDAAILIPYTVLAAALTSLSLFWKIRLDLVQKTYISAVVYSIATVALVISSEVFLSVYGIVGIGYAILLQSVLVLLGMFVSGNMQLPIPLNRAYFMSWTLSTFILVISDVIIRASGFGAMVAGLLSSGLYLLAMIFLGGIRIKEILSLAKLVLSR